MPMRPTCSLGLSAPIPAETGLLPQNQFRPILRSPAPEDIRAAPARDRYEAATQSHQVGKNTTKKARQRKHHIKKVIPKIQNQSTRTRRPFLRVSPEELAEIQTHAASAHLSFSGYAHQRLLLQPVSTHPPEELHRLRRDLAGLCNNVNQIARAVHTNAREPCKAAEEAARYAREAYDLMRRWDQDGV